MKAVRWHGKRNVSVDEVPDPTIQEPTDAIIQRRWAASARAPQPRCPGGGAVQHLLRELLDVSPSVVRPVRDHANAVPLDLLKTEMERLTRAIADAEGQVTASTTSLDKIEETLSKALAVAGRCHKLYETASQAVRRQINQGFSTKLFIGSDGEVERYELTEPFRQLLSAGLARKQAGIAEAAAGARTGRETAGGAGTAASETNGRTSPSAVLISYIDDI